ncbi:PAS domain-containing protein [Catenulispora yoronensis]
MAAILDSLPEALLLIDAGGRVVNANAVAVGWFEAPGNPLVGRSVTDLLSGFGTALARVAGGADAGAGVWTEPGDGGAAPPAVPRRPASRPAWSPSSPTAPASRPRWSAPSCPPCTAGWRSWWSATSPASPTPSRSCAASSGRPS